MKTHLHETVRLGDLVVAAFDEAERFSRDPREVSRLAAHAVAHLLNHGHGPARVEGERPPCRSPVAFS
jgi:hypothetical protein